MILPPANDSFSAQNVMLLVRVLVRMMGGAVVISLVDIEAASRAGELIFRKDDRGNYIIKVEE